MVIPALPVKAGSKIINFFGGLKNKLILSRRPKAFSSLIQQFIATPSAYVTEENLRERKRARGKWGKLIQNKKLRIMFSGWLGETATHKSLYTLTHDLWEYPEFDTIILGTTFGGQIKGNVILERMPEFIERDYEFINDAYVAKNLNFIESDIPLQALEEGITSFCEEFCVPYENGFSLSSMAYVYFKNALTSYKPNIVGLLAFQPSHRILRKVCEELHIPYFFLEFGVLDGTYCFDFVGSMGASWPNIHHEFFNGLSVDDNDMAEAEKYKNLIKTSDMGREKASACCPEKIRAIQRQRACGKRIVLYAGSNSAHSGYTPYTEENKKTHSPYYANNRDIIRDLIAYAKKQKNVHIVFKPHPITVTRNMEWRESTPEITVVTEGGINDYLDLCDICVVNVSQCSYKSLQRNKPVLMVGVNQLLNSGAVYRLSDYASLEDALEKCLESGLTPCQSRAFDLHVARVLKYYVYSYSGSFGRDIKQMAQDLHSLIQGKHPFWLKYEYKRLQEHKISSGNKL